MICWYCTQPFIKTHKPLIICCKQDGHIIDNDVHMSKEPAPDCPLEPIEKDDALDPDGRGNIKPVMNL
jgi:hypothetical protein